jgi:hypothetical protein
LNLNSGLLSKTIEKARRMDISSSNSCLISSVCIHEKKKKKQVNECPSLDKIPLEAQLLEAQDPI